MLLCLYENFMLTNTSEENKLMQKQNWFKLILRVNNNSNDYYSKEKSRFDLTATNIYLLI